MDQRKILMLRPSVQFLSVNAGGWGLAAAVNVLLQYMRNGQDLPRVLFSVIPMFFGFLFTTALRIHWGQSDIYSRSPRSIIPRLIVHSVLVTGLVVSCGIGLIVVLRGEPVAIVPLLFNNFVSMLFVILIWIALYFVVVYYSSFRWKEIENLRLQNSLHLAQLANLRHQLNPHFLFNALNNIRSLIREDAERAREMIASLTDILRYSLNAGTSQKVTIREEVAFVHEYLTLEQLHMEDRLRFGLSIAEETQHLLIPPMLIQLLAENAVKHGLNIQPAGGRLDVEVRSTGGMLSVTVANTGVLANKANGHGPSVGLANIRERLSLLYGGRAHLSLEQQGDLVVASVLLPAEAQ